ncbi:Ribonuclease Y, partial [Dissostichus eleginoides]
LPTGTHGGAEDDPPTLCPLPQASPPPCAATPALNGESPSGSEAKRLEGFRGAERDFVLDAGWEIRIKRRNRPARLGTEETECEQLSA